MNPNLSEINIISRSSIIHGSSAIEDDVWHDLDNFYMDQLSDLCTKISQLDDEIWGKMILMEKDKRVAKVYLRMPIIVVDGSNHSFDGQRIGLNSFGNSSRDGHTAEIKEKINSALLVKLDQKGNVVVKRNGPTPVIVQGSGKYDLFCFNKDVLQNDGCLEINQPTKIFDMKIFKSEMDRKLMELSRCRYNSSAVDLRSLWYRTVVRLSIVKNEKQPLKTPCWFALINLIALDLLAAYNLLPFKAQSLLVNPINFHPEERPSSLPTHSSGSKKCTEHKIFNSFYDQVLGRSSSYEKCFQIGPKLIKDGQILCAANLHEMDLHGKTNPLGFLEENEKTSQILNGVSNLYLCNGRKSGEYGKTCTAKFGEDTPSEINDASDSSVKSVESTFSSDPSSEHSPSVISRQCDSGFIESEPKNTANNEPEAAIKLPQEFSAFGQQKCRLSRRKMNPLRILIEDDAMSSLHL